VSPPRPLPLARIPRPFTPLRVYWLLNSDGHISSSRGGVPPTHLGDDDDYYNDDDEWTVSTAATTGTASMLCDGGGRNDDDWGGEDHHDQEREQEQVGRRAGDDSASSSSSPPVTIVTFTTPSSTENGSNDDNNFDDDYDDCFCMEGGNEIEGEGGTTVFPFSMHEMPSTIETEPCGQAYASARNMIFETSDSVDEHATAHLINQHHAAQHLIS
jgi:hypothetical protein